MVTDIWRTDSGRSKRFTAPLARPDSVHARGSLTARVRQQLAIALQAMWSSVSVKQRRRRRRSDVNERTGVGSGDAERFLADLRERFAKFALELHPGKTRLIEFGRLAARRRKARRLGKPETFDFLGFTHICGKTRDGRFGLRRVTISERMRAKLREVKEELLRRRHQPVPERGRWLGSGCEGTAPTTPCPVRPRQSEHSAPRRPGAGTGRCGVAASARLNWKRMDRLATRWLPQARVRHPWPSVRFDARTRGRSPVR